MNELLTYIMNLNEEQVEKLVENIVLLKTLLKEGAAA